MKKVVRKARIATSVLKEQGLIEFSIRSLRFIQKKTSKTIPAAAQKQSIYTKAKYEEIIRADITRPANANWTGRTDKKLTFNWLMPPPGKGSGGHMTLYRFIEYLEKAGHTCRIYMHNPGPYSTVESVRAIMGNSFPEVKAPMAWLFTNDQMEPADAIFATSWETAYSVYDIRSDSKKFYFVQDFEPAFYPVGSLSVLAENTYRLGLRGITAGDWLKKKLHEEYGMVTDSFWFGSDGNTYRHLPSSIRKEVVFYARPTTERRAFELGIMTLDLFHKRHPDYTINFIGWDVSSYDIPFPYKNLGILDPSELNKLYNRCAASLVLSLTNMSLLPLELLASGCIPVVNDGENNRLVTNNEYIAYAPANPVSLADKLSEVVSRSDIDSYSQAASESARGLSWDESGDHFVGTVTRAIATKGNG